MAQQHSKPAGKRPHVLPIVQRQPLNANHLHINNSGSAASFVSDVLTVQRVWKGGGLYLVKTTGGGGGEKKWGTLVSQKHAVGAEDRSQDFISPGFGLMVVFFLHAIYNIW